MEKLFAALIPVVCVMALGPLCCRNAAKTLGSNAPEALGTVPVATDTKSLL